MVNHVFIRGESGVGKTSVARKLGKLFPAGVTIEMDSIQAMLHSSQSKDLVQYSDAFGAACLVALHFTESGYGPIIIIGSFADGHLEEWTKAAVPGRSRVYTLLVSEQALRQRKQSPGDRTPAVHIPLSENGKLFKPLEEIEEVVIDTSALDIEGVCKVIAENMIEEDKSSIDDDIFNYG